MLEIYSMVWPKIKIARKMAAPLLDAHGQGTVCMYWGAQSLGVRTPRQLNFIWWCQIFRRNYCSLFPCIQKCVSVHLQQAESASQQWRSQISPGLLVLS